MRISGLQGGFRQFSAIAAPLLAGLALVLFTVQLGQWQLRRAAEKTALQHTIDARIAQPATALGQDEPAEWTPLQLTGQWHAEHVLYLDNRIHQGRAGYHVYSPFRDAASGRWVMVARGWIAAGADRNALPALPRSAGLTTLNGHVRLPGEAYTLAPGAADGQRWQAVDLAAWRQATGLPLTAFTVQQTSPAADGLTRDWPRPDAGIDRHRGYALQWFALATLAAALCAGYLWHLLRRRPA
jgi:surfeit locus 1 family protein